jgi:hypothetical protein
VWLAMGWKQREEQATSGEVGGVEGGLFRGSQATSVSEQWETSETDARL